MGMGGTGEKREKGSERLSSQSPFLFPSSLSTTPFDARYAGYIIAANIAGSCPIDTQIPLSFSSSVSGTFAPLLCRSKIQLIFVTLGQLCALLVVISD